MLCAKFSRNWPSASGEEDESWQTAYGQTLWSEIQTEEKNHISAPIDVDGAMHYPENLSQCKLF